LIEQAKLRCVPARRNFRVTFSITGLIIVPAQSKDEAEDLVHELEFDGLLNGMDELKITNIEEE